MKPGFLLQNACIKMPKVIVCKGEKEALEELRRAAEGGKFREAAQKAVDDCLDIVAEEARRIVPVDTGRLKRSIKTKRRKNVTWGEVFCDYPKPQNPKKTKHGQKEYYAFAVVYGSRTRIPDPFLRPAVEKTEDVVEERMGKVLKEVMP